jgi:hypothetical protein
MNTSLALMVILSLLPVDIAQAFASVRHRLWDAGYTMDFPNFQPKKLSKTSKNLLDLPASDCASWTYAQASATSYAVLVVNIHIGRISRKLCLDIVHDISVFVMKNPRHFLDAVSRRYFYAPVAMDAFVLIDLVTVLAQVAPKGI